MAAHSANTAAFYTKALAEPRPATAEDLLGPPPAWLRQAVAALDPGAPRSVLDLGYGAGVQAIAVATQGFDVTAVDQVPPHLFLNRWRSHPVVNRVSLIESRLENYSSKVPFGVVLALDVLHFLPAETARRLLVELSDAAPPGALHALRIFVDIDRTEHSLDVVLDGEARFTRESLSSLLDDAYRGWAIERRWDFHRERSVDGSYRFSATAGTVIARRPP